MKTEQILLSMGYRELAKDIYAKPVGTNLFTFQVSTLEWTNWFTSDDKKQYVWNRVTYIPNVIIDDFLHFIKQTEGETRIFNTYGHNSGYEFLIPEQIFNQL